jgi:hypothetical protein
MDRIRADNEEPSEFEVQAETFFRLRGAFDGIAVRGEYHFRSAQGNRVARFDLVLLRGQDIRLIVEVKKASRTRSRTQARKYNALTNRPVMYIRGMGQAIRSVEEVRRFLAKKKIEL